MAESAAEQELGGAPASEADQKSEAEQDLGDAPTSGAGQKSEAEQDVSTPSSGAEFEIDQEAETEPLMATVVSVWRLMSRN